MWVSTLTEVPIQIPLSDNCRTDRAFGCYSSGGETRHRIESPHVQESKTATARPIFMTREPEKKAHDTEDQVPTAHLGSHER